MHGADPSDQYRKTTDIYVKIPASNEAGIVLCHDIDT